MLEFWNKAGGIHYKIREKLYQLRTSGITVQQDGAKAHTGHDSVNVINQYIQQGGWNSILVNQPTQSPDLKMLDLGLFHGMKSKADGIKGDGRNIDTCIQRMLQSFQEYSPRSIEIVWGVLIEIYRLILDQNGDNDYELPHSEVRRRSRTCQ